MKPNICEHPFFESTGNCCHYTMLDDLQLPDKINFKGKRADGEKGKLEGQFCSMTSQSFLWTMNSIQLECAVFIRHFFFRLVHVSIHDLHIYGFLNVVWVLLGMLTKPVLENHNILSARNSDSLWKMTEIHN